MYCSAIHMQLSKDNLLIAMIEYCDACSQACVARMLNVLNGSYMGV